MVGTKYSGEDGYAPDTDAYRHNAGSELGEPGTATNDAQDWREEFGV